MRQLKVEDEFQFYLNREEPLFLFNQIEFNDLIKTLSLKKKKCAQLDSFIQITYLLLIFNFLTLQFTINELISTGRI